VHIKTPSEHTILLQHSPVEMQFEHDLDFKKSYITPLEKAHVPFKLMVAVLVDPGLKNAFLDKVLDKIPKDEDFKTAVPKEPVEVDESVDEGKSPLMYILGDTLMAEQATEFDYASYMGSMTQPPCTEKVLWFVMLKPVFADLQQLTFIDRLWSTKPSRHLQKQNNRPISYGFYYNSNIVNGISKRIIKNKQSYFGILPAYSRKAFKVPKKKEPEGE